MDEFTKIILSGILMIQWGQLGLIIARSWDKESRQDKSITGVLTRFSILILSIIAIVIIIYSLKFIWTY
jgi:hypothetical protein